MTTNEPSPRWTRVLDGMKPQLAPGDALRLSVLIPVYDDWESLRILIDMIDAQFHERPISLEFLIVDDGSPTGPGSRFDDLALHSTTSITLLELRRNCGHQRAIAIGLAWLHANAHPHLVCVLDGDGEDAPEDIPRLIDACITSDYQSVVFAQREKRSESAVFKIFYSLYKLIHRTLVGHDVSVGNFSVMPPSALARLVAVSDLWNHYAASVFKSRIPHTQIPTGRAKRLRGEAKMNFVSLVTHGLAAFSVFGEKVGTRLLLISSLAVVGFVMGIMYILVKKWMGDAIVGWASSMVGIFAILVVQLLTGSLIFALTTIGARSQAGFLPVRDFESFVLAARRMPFANSSKARGSAAKPSATKA